MPDDRKLIHQPAVLISSISNMETDDTLPFMNTRHSSYSCINSDRYTDISSRTEETDKRIPRDRNKMRGFQFRHCFVSTNMLMTFLFLISLFHGVWGQTLNPTITSSANTVELINGQQYTLLCQLEVSSSLVPGAPFPLSWSRQTTSLPAGSQTNEATQILDGTTAYQSRLTFTATPNDNSRQIICSVTLGSFSGSASYIPQLILTPSQPVVTGPTQVRAGEQHQWVCVSAGASLRIPSVDFRDPDGNIINDNTDPTTLVDIVNNKIVMYTVTHRMTTALPATQAQYLLECQVKYVTDTYTAPVQSVQYVVSVIFSPTLTKAGDDAITVTEGTSITLSCLVAANPAATSVSWTKDGVPLDVTSSRYEGGTVSLPSLLIKSTQKSDFGTYSCSATNAEGTASLATPTSLTVRYQPLITYTTTSFNGGFGGAVTLPCPVAAVPDATTIRWKRVLNGLTSTIRADRDARYTVQSPVTKNYGLTINPLEVSDGDGQYYCEADNDVGSGTGSRLTLAVNARPFIESGPGSVQAIENQAFVVPCVVTPLATLTAVTWLKNGVNLDLTSPAGKYAGGTTSTPSLTVTSATASDAGIYRCAASNVHGTRTGDPVTVILSYRPRPTVPPALVTRSSGQDVVLTCTIDSSPEPTQVYWTQNGNGQLTSTTNSVKYSGGTVATPSLTIRNANLQDSGAYRCVAINSIGQGNSQLLQVNIEGTPLVTVTPLQANAAQGDQNFMLTCSYLTNPSAFDLYWTKDGSIIPSDASKRTGGTLASPNLIIRTVEPSDAGAYRCVVRNSVGTGTSSSITMTVTYAPIVTVSSSDINTSTRRNINLVCIVDSNPPATDVYWTRTGVGRIDSSANPSKYRNGDLADPTLVILDTAISDTGVYSCIAVNVLGNAGSLGVRVFVNDVPTVTAVQPASSVQENQLVTLTCSFQAVPDASDVYWTKDGSRLDVAGQSGQYQGATVAIPSLTILRVRSTDLGSYVCYVVNSQGTGSSSPVTLQVNYSPKIAPTSDSISRSIGSTVTLTCSVDANPPISDLYWVKSGQGRILDSDNRYSGGNVASPNLVILTAVTSDTAGYYCVASNNVGSTTSATVAVSIIGVPRVTATGPTSNVLEGNTVTLNCAFESVPQADQVYWTKDTARVNMATQGSKFTGSTVATPSLTIRSLEADDLGTYRCFVVNSVDTGSSNSISLDVWFAPILTVSTQPIVNGPGSQVILRCDVRSNPAPTQVYWRKSGVPGQISSATRPAKYGSGDLVNPSLVIFNTELSDTGTYFCVVSNNAGSRESDPVSVAINSIPVVTTSPIPGPVQRGSTAVTLTCSFQAVPEATEVYWTQDGTRLNVAGQPSKYIGSTLATPSLSIADVERSDDGTYVCYVVNSIGRGFGQPLVLVISFAPVMFVPADPVNQSPGTFLTLTCRVEANPAVTDLYWVKVETGARISSSNQPSKYVGGTVASPDLGIVSAQTEDSGTYTCVAVNTLGTTTSDPVTVNVISIPSVTVASPPASVDEGQSVTLGCSFRAVPLASGVFWTKGGARVDVAGQPGRYSGATVGTPSLTIVSLVPDDQGSYMCNVVNTIGTGSSSAAQLVVNYRPVVSVPSQTISRRPGNAVLLLCTVDANPAASDVYWTKTGPGRIVPASNPNKYSGGDSSNPNLQIRDTTSDDTGSYFCVASNRLGTTTSGAVSVAIINVPSVTTSTPSTSVQVGSVNVILTCTYVANPTATDLYWTLDGTLVNSATQSSVYVGGTFADPSLTLRTITRNSAGSYVCNVVNSLGTGSSTGIAMDVTYRPVITVPSQAITGSPGSSLTLTAQVDANPAPTDVYWTKVGQGRIDSSSNPGKYTGGTLATTSLTIVSTSLADTGTYTFVVVNAVGTTTSNGVTVSIENIPVVVVSPAAPSVSELTQNVIFTCSYQANPSPTQVYWTKDGRVIDGAASGGRFTGGTLASPLLTITTVTRAEAGSYACNVINSVGLGKSTDIVLNVQYKPTITVPDGPIRNSPGATVILTCQIQANPAPSDVYWVKSGQGPISSVASPNKYVGGNANNPTLRILDADIGDSGTYNCVAVNTEGLVQSAALSVDIVNIPSVTASSSASTVDEGVRNILFTCTYQANPAATELYWTQNGQRLDSNASPAKYSGGTLVQSTLTIRTVDKTDSGSFACNVLNSIGTGISTNVDFNVLFVPFITTGDATAIGARGSSITLACDVTANPALTSLYWTKDGAQINLSQPPGKYTGGTTGTPALTIFNLDETSDVASFGCVATNAKGTSTSQPVQLRVSFDPVVTTPSSVSGKEQQVLTITCSVQMFPAATQITWYKDDAQLNVIGQSNKYTGGVAASPSLTIISAAKSDSGVYRCEANNGQTTVASGNAQVTVTYTPKITSQPNLESSLGTSATLQCLVDASPAFTTLVWRYLGNTGGNTVILNTNTARFSGGTVATPSLTINSVQASDTGTYTCEAGNSEGTATGTAIDFKVRYAPGTVTVISNPLTLNAGDQFTMTCTSDGYPAPSFEWTRNGVSISTANTFTRVATSDDDTAFACTATNVLGSDSVALNLDVKYSPEVTVTVPQNKFSPLGGQVTLTCDVKANPLPIEYQWYKRGALLVGRTGRSEDITFSSDADFGEYYCTARNTRGTTNPAVTFEVTKSNIPTPPSNVLATATPSTLTAGATVTLTCQADGFPAPEYTWTRGSTVISNLATFNRVSEVADNTQFLCTATNDNGLATGTVDVDVQYAPLPVRNAVVVVTGDIEDVVTLTCEVSANPVVTDYVWYQDNNVIAGLKGRTLEVTINSEADYGSYSCGVTNDIGTLNPAARFSVQSDPGVGASTDSSSGLSTTTIILIVVIVIIIVIILILILVLCLLGKCARKKENSRVAPVVDSKPHPAYTNGTGHFGPVVTASSKEKLKLNEDNEDVMPSNGGPIISLPEKQGPRAHHLPPLSLDTPAVESYYREEKRRSRKKKRRRRLEENANTTEADNKTETTNNLYANSKNNYFDDNNVYEQI